MQPGSAPGEIRIDKEGCWLFNGAPIINPAILELFNAGIEHDGSGGYRLHIEDEIHPLVVEDTPYVVTGLEPAQDGCYEIRISDGSREMLCLESLYISQDNIPYCTIKNGRFPARFLRQPYYELARHIEQDDQGRFFLEIQGQQFYIAQQR